jgi:hypothetical protein
MLRRAGVLGGLGALVAMVGLVVPAQADDLKALCQVSGDATTSSPIPLTAASGTYTFSSQSFVCTGVDNGSPGTVQLNVMSSGTYDSLVCGTATLTSRPGQTTVTSAITLAGSPSTTDYLALFDGVGYEISLVGGNGALTWDGAAGGGAVQATPVSFEAPPGCVNGLRFNGVVMLAKDKCHVVPQEPVISGTSIVGKSSYYCDARQQSILGCARLWKRDPVSGMWWPASKGPEVCKNDVDAFAAPDQTDTAPCVTGSYQTTGRGTAVFDGLVESSNRSMQVWLDC